MARYVLRFLGTVNRVVGNFQGLDVIPRAPGTTLLRRFTLLSLATTIIVGVLFGVITAQLVEDFALRRQARATALHVSELAGSRLILQDFLVLPPAGQAQFERAMHDVVGRAGIVHLTVWNQMGQVLFVENQGGSVGTPPPLAPFKVPLDSQLRWRLVPSPGQSSRANPLLLEVFAPVVVPGLSRPVAMYEILADLADLAPALTRLKWSVEISVILGVLSLYAVLFTIVRKASRDLEYKDSALRGTLTGVIRSLINALDARDMATASHSSRVAVNAVAIARELGLDETAIGEVQAAAYLHDIGKIGVRDDILTKTGPLTEAERTIVRQHTLLGFEILDPVPIPDGIKLAVRHSHEHWDGRGYPGGLASDQIPLAARIIAVADAYEALTTDRPYRPAQSPRRAVEEIKRNGGIQFDPTVVEAFLRVLQSTTVVGNRRHLFSAGPIRPQGSTRPQRAARG